ncbi:MAG: hypothetical protein J6M12_06755 [Clostridia bacterium]|nr:hypothetical protein [Clostridia bacterium]
MKKTIRILSLTLALITLLFTLASCAPTLDGEYEADLSIGDFSITSGSLLFTKSGEVKYTATLFTGSKTYVGEYEINEKLGTIELDFEDDSCSLNGDHEFSQDKKAGTITIGSTTYKKK